MSGQRDAALRLARGTLEAVCIACLAMLVLVTSYDVVGRYVFNAPLASAFSLARMLMALMVFAALPLASAADEHLRAGLFDAKWSATGLRMRAIVVHAVSTFACAVLTWRLATQAGEYASNGDMIEVVDVPASWVVWIMAALALIGTGACAVVFVRAWQGRAGGSVPPSATAAEAAA